MPSASSFWRASSGTSGNASAIPAPEKRANSGSARAIQPASTAALAESFSYVAAAAVGVDQAQRVSVRRPSARPT